MGSPEGGADPVRVGASGVSVVRQVRHTQEFAAFFLIRPGPQEAVADVPRAPVAPGVGQELVKGSPRNFHERCISSDARRSSPVSGPIGGTGPMQGKETSCPAGKTLADGAVPVWLGRWLGGASVEVGGAGDCVAGLPFGARHRVGPV
ncbi:hypothetical protein GCM10009867_19660 [Pedococcus aerophilus]|uniref:Uncharacterized protein n=1 Tax=Pedococcus aerophilus TaxID=436356 RepID=A0ABN3UN16_9MICO